MGRAKLKLELIPNSRSRRVTFEKRKKGLMKKAEEFKTLCGVDTCVVIYPMGTSGDDLVKPEIWPTDSKEVERILCRYQSEAAHRRAKHVTGLREFFASRNKKINAELAEVRRANWEAKYQVSEEILKDIAEPQVRSLQSTFRDELKQAKTTLATLKEKRRAKTVAQSDWNVASIGGDKEERRVEMAVAPSDWTVPSSSIDLHASHAGFTQDWVDETGVPHEFLYLQNKEESRVETPVAPSDWIEPSSSIDFHTSSAGFVQDGRVEEELPFEFTFEEGLPFEFTFEEGLPFEFMFAQ